MPLMGGSRKRSRGNIEQADGSRLQGWNFIQEKVLSHDEDMIADYADDIDTLLVFAGLFSAVLTAFLVASLVLLQPDNSQTTVQILSIIALQNGVPDSLQNFLNETADSLPASPAFKASTSAATINTLWFTSLVLSLAAALFGILAKQWCREYLRWHSTILPARENVLIRQVRFEAWERWQVASFVASIPALLEIALIIFLIGLPMFVRTFSELTLTIFVSLVIALTLLGVIVLTVLPVFYRLCPFQTPTGWAFVRLAGPARRMFWYITKLVAVLFDHSLRGANVDRVRRGLRRRDWRRHLWLWSTDKLSHMEKLKNWRAYGLYSVEDAENCMPAVTDYKQAFSDINADVDHAAVDAVQTSALFRVLLWVRLGSNDEAVIAAVEECIPSIHVAISTVYANQKPHFLAAIHAICPIDVSVMIKMLRSSISDSPESHLSPNIGPLSPLRIIDVDFVPTFMGTRGYSLKGPYRAVCEAWTSDSVSLELCHALARSDLLSLVDDWLSFPVGTWRPENRRAVAEHIVLLLCVLCVIPSEATRRAVRHAGLDLSLSWAKTLEEVYRKLAPHKAAYADGLVSMCVQVRRLLGPVNFGRVQGENHICAKRDAIADFAAAWGPPPPFQECILVSTWVTLAVDIHQSPSHFHDHTHTRHLFVTSVSRVFRTLRLRMKYFPQFSVADRGEMVAPLSDLLSCMVDALRLSLMRSQRNCGAYISLPWVGDIVRCYQDAYSEMETIRGAESLYLQSVLETLRDPLALIPLTGIPTLRPTFFLVLRLIKTCIDRNLIGHTTSSPSIYSERAEGSISEVRGTSAAEFDQLLELLQYPDLPDLPADLTIEALEAQKRAVGAELQDFDDLEDTDDYNPELPGEGDAEWAWSPVHAPTRTINIGCAASACITAAREDGNFNGDRKGRVNSLTGDDVSEITSEPESVKSSPGPPSIAIPSQIFRGGTTTTCDYSDTATSEHDRSTS